MLKGLTSPKLIPQAAPSHEDLFMQRYERLLRAARRLTSGSERSQDLVHNAFVQFMLSRPDIASIHDLDGYLLIMLRNMNVSQARRAAIVQTVALSAADYDSAEAGLRATDAHAQLQVREQLRLICDYACQRKERSKIGSALILRFFHGYYPAEVAKVFRSTRDVVDKWLSLARHEALAYVEDPSSLKLIEGQPKTVIPDNQAGASLTEFLRDLRQSIFLARGGDCPADAQLIKIYSDQPGTLSTEYLSHIVSCSRCLDEINLLLDLPSLAERFPMETFGRDPKPPGGSGPGDDGGGGMSGGKNIDKLKQVSRRRMTDVLEHRPKELRVAVNGYVLGSQSVCAESNKLALSVNLNERVGFIEVFSEQGFCLMFSNIGAPPDGALEQETHVELSEGRTLDLNLNFIGPWPTVDVVYHDPTLTGESGVPSLESGVSREAEVASLGAEAPSVPGKRKSLWMRSRSWFDSRLPTPDWRLFLRPGAATAVVAILVIAALFIMKLRHGPETAVTAAELLSQASAVEDTIAARADQVLHRTINFEEKKASGEGIARNRIESWQSAQRGITARRLYDERGALVAGDWRRADGVQTIYHHGQRPQLQIRNPQSAIRNFEDVWQLSVSAKEFSLLIGATQRAHVEESAISYSIKYTREADDSPGLIKATLVLSRADLHTLEESLTVRQGSEVREYSFVETSYERRPLNAVAPSVFEPEPVLLESDTGTRRHGDTENVPASPRLPVSASLPLATPELELEVLKQLNQADAFYGEQISFTRTPEGRLRIQGIVETEKRKGEILQALSFVRRNPAVQVQVETVAEAGERQARQRSASSGSIEAGNVEVEAKSAIPAEPELRAYLSSRRGLSGEALDREIRRYADRVMAHARQARRHALALKQIAERFSPDDLQALDGDARNQWRAMIAQHAKQIQQELEAMRRELQLVFPSLGSEQGDAGIEISGGSDLAHAGKQLYELAVVVDESVGRSFSIYASGNTSAPVKTGQFSISLRSAMSLAQRIARSE